MGLNNLKEVYLITLSCINKSFKTPAEIATMRRIVNEHCGPFKYTTTTVATAIKTPAESTTEIVPCANEPSSNSSEMLTALINRTNMECENCKSEIITKTRENAENLITIAKLEGKLALSALELAHSKSDSEILLLKKKIEEMTEELQMVAVKIQGKDEEIWRLQQRLSSDEN